MNTDILVIGAGTAGLRTALTAASNGAKVVLVGDGKIAGTCLNTGCIPTKTMLHAADVLRTVQDAKGAGITASGKPDFSAIMKRVRSISKEGRDHAIRSVENNENLTYIKGRAEFLGDRLIQVGNERVRARHVIIATGSRTFVPPVPGLKDTPFITNVEAVELTKQPEHLVILGGGYIACEFATFFATLGTKVTIVERAKTILGMLDDDIRSYVRESLDELGVEILTNTSTTKVSHSTHGFTLTLASEDRKRVSGDQLLVATGRRPNTDGLGLEKTGVRLDQRGNIETNGVCRTSNKNIFAIGDVNGTSLFAHTAKREGWLVLEHILLNNAVRMSYDDIPWAVFTHPAVAGVGLSETQLQKAGEEYEVWTADFYSTGKARIIRQDKGTVKLLLRRGKLLGAFIAGPDADNLIHEFVALKHMGKDALSTLKRMVHIHPTLAEVCENLSPRR